MREYYSPKIIINQLTLKENTASLNDWLSTNGLEYAGITTYVINS